MAVKTPISDLMTTRVKTLPLDAAPSEAHRLFVEEDIHHLPVIEGGAVVGVLSTRDLVRMLRAAGGAHGKALDDALGPDATVERMMSRDLVTMRPDESVETAIDLIAEGEVHSVLVVDDGQKLVGIATDRDLLDFYCS